MKSKLLLHTCCAICSCHVLDKLRQEFDVTAYFYNPNISPREEYEKRRDSVKDWCEKVGLTFLEGSSGFNEWSEAILGLEKEPEGGTRCPVCFRVRLEETAKFAKTNGFEYFATTLTMGRNKRADIINPIGQDLAKKYRLNFYEADWKKAGGQERAYEIAKENNLYHQNYCGCLFSQRLRS